MLQGHAVRRDRSYWTYRTKWRLVFLEVRWAWVMSKKGESTLIGRRWKLSEESEPSLWGRRGWSRRTVFFFVLIEIAVRVLHEGRGPIIIGVRIEQIPGAEPCGLRLQVLQSRRFDGVPPLRS